MLVESQHLADELTAIVQGDAQTVVDEAHHARALLHPDLLRAEWLTSQPQISEPLQRAARQRRAAKNESLTLLLTILVNFLQV